VQTNDESYEVEHNEGGGKCDDRPRAAPDNPETVNLARVSSESGRRSKQSTYEQHLRTQCGESIHGFTKKVGRGACVGEEQDLPKRVRVEDEEPVVGEVDGTRTVLVYKVCKRPLNIERKEGTHDSERDENEPRADVDDGAHCTSIRSLPPRS
jgi:hypothetical protein